MSAEPKKSSPVFSMIKLGLVLAAYAAVSCTVLAVVNHFTAPKIEANRIEKANAMLKELFPMADSFEQKTDFEYKGKTIRIESLYVAYSDGDVIGGAVQVSGPTYDSATIITGIDLEGKVMGLNFLELKDSPGYGQKAKDSSFLLPSGKTFYQQFVGKSSSQEFKAGVNFDAISGATITSNGVAGLMNTGISVLASYLKEKGYE